jgi:hypothetical protein
MIYPSKKNVVMCHISIHSSPELQPKNQKDIIRAQAIPPIFPICHILLRCLLLQIRLDPPLPCLTLIMLPLRLRLLPLIPRQSRDRTPNRPSNAIANALAQVVHLTSSLLALPLLVLSNTLLLEALCADKTTNGLFGGANVLVPRAVSAVLVVFCNAARGADGEGTSFGGGVREVFFGGSDVFFVLAMDLGEIMSIWKYGVK